MGILSANLTEQEGNGGTNVLASVRARVTKVRPSDCILGAVAIAAILAPLQSVTSKRHVKFHLNRYMPSFSSEKLGYEG